MLAQPLPDRPPERPTKRPFPWVLVAVLAVKAAALAWMAYFGFPREWGDVVFFKQPAYMALHTGAFSLPTAIGYRPFADITYAAYPPLYTYASLLVFRLFGFNVHSSLAFDLGVHLLFTGLIGWILWRKMRNQLAAGLLVLLSTGFLLPEGRPDEMAALLALLAVMAVVRRRYVLVALLLGLSLATQPTQAILGLVLCLSMDLVASGLTPKIVARSAAVAGGAVAVCVLIWLPAVLPHLPEAVAQFVAHSTDRWSLGLGELFARDLIWATFWVFVVIFVATCGLFLVFRSPEALRRGTEEGLVLRGILLAMPPCIGFLLIIGSPYYGYRLLNVLYLATAFYLAYVLFGATLRLRSRQARTGPPAPTPLRGPAATLGGNAAPPEVGGLGGRFSGQRMKLRRAVAVASFAGIVLLSTATNYNIVRFILAPLTWDASSVTYARAVAAVRAVVPPDATVGGDSTIWWAITDGRPFYSLSWYQGEPWPTYILSTTFWGKGGKPIVLQRQGWADRIAAEYVEITPSGPPAGACALHLLGREMPLSRSGGGCDWRVRIWERK